MLMIKHEDKVFATCPNADFAALDESDVVEVTHLGNIEKEILLDSKELTAMVISRPPYASICIDCKKPIHAVLDDMAQIVGEVVQVVPYEKKSIAKALKKAGGVMIERGSLITTGRTMYEAFTAMTVLEKTAEVILKAPVIGGARRLSHSDAAKMRSIYKKSYSKAEKEHKNAVEG